MSPRRTRESGSSRSSTSRAVIDSDTLALRRASRIVGTRIAITCSAVVVLIIAAMFIFILSKISPAELFEAVPDEDNLKVDAVDLLRGAAVLGIALIVLAGVMSWLVTRRAVQPLGDALRIQRAFIADASHELRTPLTVLDARLQILQRTLPEGDQSAGIVTELRRDTTSLVQIVNDLLESAEAEGPVENTTPVDVLPPIELAVHSMSLIGADKNITITVDAPGPASSFVPATSIQRCLVALLDNALRFSPADSTVTVEVVTSKNLVSVTVRDSGPGIQGIDPARIFDRFAHSGTSVDGGGDTRTGFGIGLSLVREIAVRHGGSVRVVESSAAGTAIAFEVPRARHP